MQLWKVLQLGQKTHLEHGTEHCCACIPMGINSQMAGAPDGLVAACEAYDWRSHAGDLDKTKVSNSNRP